MRRGDLVVAVAPGAHGKPRPFLVVQSDLATRAGSQSVTVAPLTSTVRGAPLFRVTIDPSAENGLRTVSQVMVDKLVTLPRQKLGKPFGRLDFETMQRVNRSLSLWLGLV